MDDVQEHAGSKGPTKLPSGMSVSLKGLCVTASGVIALAFAGCGSSGGTGSNGSSGGVPTACSVFTAAVARSELGSSAHIIRNARPNPHETQCEYAGKRGAAIELAVGDWSFIHEFAASAGKPVPGIGDEAYLSSTELSVRKGSNGMSITAFPKTGIFFGASADRQQALADAMEKKIAPKLLPHL